jgi:hypothetical protein
MVRTDFKSLQAFREAPERFVDDPMSVVDDESFDYETKLHLLQHWLARITDGEAPDAGRTNVEAAIQALQARAKLKTEEPKDAPEIHTYGVVERSDLRRYSVSALAQRIWRFFRKKWTGRTTVITNGPNHGRRDPE